MNRIFFAHPYTFLATYLNLSAEMWRFIFLNLNLLQIMAICFQKIIEFVIKIFQMKEGFEVKDRAL
jgi:hypothetical protein